MAARSPIHPSLNTICDTAEAQATLLEQTLQDIDAVVGPHAPGLLPDKDEAWQWTLLRVRTLQRYDRIFTAQALSNGAYNPRIYELIRDADLTTIAESFAASGNLTAVGILLYHHPYALAANILDILSAIPETTHSKLLEELLRQVATLVTSAPSIMLRRPDWTESEAISSALQRHREHALFLATEHLAKFALGGLVAPTEAQLIGWIKSRAIAIDRLTGQLEASIELLKRAQALLSTTSIQGLVEMEKAAQQLILVLKRSSEAGRENSTNPVQPSSCGDDDSEDQENEQKRDAPGSSILLSPSWRLDLETFSSMNETSRLLQLCSLISEEALVDDGPSVIAQWIAPFLSLTTHPRQTLQGMITQRARDGHVSWVTTLIQLEAERLGAFAHVGDAAAAAVAACYACPYTDAWEYCEALLNAATDALSIADSGSVCPPDPQSLQKLQEEVTVARGHLVTAQTFSEYGLPTSMATVRDATHSDASNLINSLLECISRSYTSEGSWDDTLVDIEAACNAGLSSVVSEKELRKEFCRALLRCDQLRLAKRYLDSLEERVKEDLVLVAARDAFYSDDSTKKASARHAENILALLPDSIEAKHEAAFIQAAAKLRSFGVDIPPLQLRQTEDKAALLQRAIEAANGKALRDVDGLVEISESLGTGLAKNEVMVLVGEAALEKGEVKLGETIAMQLAAIDAREGWQVASRMAMEERCSTEAHRRSLLSYAMRHAPPAELSGLLHCWQASDAGASGDADAWGITGGREEDVNVVKAGTPTAATAVAHAAALDDTVNQYLLVRSANVVRDERNGLKMPQYGKQDGLLVLNCLLALGPEAVQRFAKEVQRKRDDFVGNETLREAHILGLTAASIMVVQACDPNVKPGTLLSMPPADLVSLALQAQPQQATGPSQSATASAPGTPRSVVSIPPCEVDALKTLIHEVCQQLVSAADAQKVAKFLPGSQAVAGRWLDGNAASQRDLVLQLARAAGGTINTNSNTDAEAGGKTFDEALVLAQRCGVEAWEVQQAYIIAVLLRNTQQIDLLDDVKKDLQIVWPELLESKAAETLEALLLEVLPQLLTLSEYRSDVVTKRVVRVLHLCAQCCGRLEDETIGSNGRMTFTLLAGVVESLHECSPQANFASFISLPLHALRSIFASSNQDFFMTGTVADTVADITDQLLEYSTADNAQEFNTIINNISCICSSLDVAECRPFSLSGIDAFRAAALQELSTMTVAEGVDSTQRVRLQQCFVGMKADIHGIVSIAQFACLGGAPPLHGTSNHVAPVLLTPEQSLEVLTVAIETIDQVTSGADIGSHEAIEQLRREQTRLVTIQELETTCSSLDQEHLLATKALIPQLLSVQDASDGRNLVVKHAAGLFAAGVLASKVLSVVSVCVPIVPVLPGSTTRKDDLAKAFTKEAVEVAVKEALETLSGNGGSKELSIGDAIQNLYGVLRSLDEDNTEECIASIASLRDTAWPMLRSFAAQQQTSTDAAAAEAHLQVLEMLGLLGRSMWTGWLPSQGEAVVAGDLGSGDAAGGTFKHAEALLFSRTAAILAGVWPGALQNSGIVADDFGGVERVEDAMIKLIERASEEGPGATERLRAIVVVLHEVLSDTYPPNENTDASSLHRGWHACLHALLQSGDLHGALAALDRAATAGKPSTSSLVLESEAESLVKAADAGFGIAGAACVALVTNYARLQTVAWDKVKSLPGNTNDIQALPGVAQLAILALLRGRLGDLAADAGSTGLFKQLSLAMLRLYPSILALGGIASSTSKDNILPVRSALATALAAQLVENDQFSAACWVAMEHSNTHRLLRILDNGPDLAKSLLSAGSSATGLKDGELHAHASEAVVVGRSVETIIRKVPGLAQEAAEKFKHFADS